MLHFKEQYQSDYWKRKRLEIIRRDGWKCLACFGTNKVLQVHHLYYEKDKFIWEYDDDAYVTLCKDCHEIIHNDLKKLGGLVAFDILRGKIDINDYRQFFDDISEIDYLKEEKRKRRSNNL